MCAHFQAQPFRASDGLSTLCEVVVYDFLEVLVAALGLNLHAFVLVQFGLQLLILLFVLYYFGATIL